MAGVITSCVAILVMALIAVFVAIVAAVSTVSGFGKPEDMDEN